MLGLGCLFLVVWTVLVNVPEFVGPEQKNHTWSNNLTTSWEEALAVFFERGAQAGTDYIFTYGPLGFLASSVFDPPIFWHKYVWELLISLFSAWVFLKIFLRLPDLFSKALFTYLVLSQDLDYVDNRCALILLASVLLLLDSQALAFFLAALAVFAVLGLMKFTFLVLGAVFVAGLTLWYALGRRRGLAVAIPLVYALFLLAGWSASRQALTSVPGYLRGSYEIAKGYGEAMCMPVLPVFLWLGLAQIGLIGSLALVLERGPRLRFWAAWALIAAGVFTHWKLGFTRDDHTRVFFKYGMFVPFVVLAAFRARPRRWPVRWLLTAAAVVVGFAGMSVVPGAAGTYRLSPPEWSELIGPLALPHTPRGTQDYGKSLLGRADFMAAPLRMRLALQETRDRDRLKPLFPWLGRLVGDASIDLFSFNQGLLFTQNLNWRPRPVFQSYSAYTPYLLRKNGDFYASDQAPDYVVLSSPAVDVRLYAHEDSQALQEILRRYRPLSGDLSLYVLKRDDTVERAPPPSPVLLRRTLKLRRWVDDSSLEMKAPALDISQLPEPYQTLSLRIRYSWWGRVRAFFYQPPPLWVGLACSDRQQPRWRRLIPGMAADDFLINPFLDGPGDLMSAYTDPQAVRVQALDVMVMGDKSCYEDEVEVTVKSVSGIKSGPVAAARRP